MVYEDRTMRFGDCWGGNWREWTRKVKRGWRGWSEALRFVGRLLAKGMCLVIDWCRKWIG